LDNKPFFPIRSLPKPLPPGFLPPKSSLPSILKPPPQVDKEPQSSIAKPSLPKNLHWEPIIKIRTVYRLENPYVGWVIPAQYLNPDGSRGEVLHCRRFGLSDEFFDGEAFLEDHVFNQERRTNRLCPWKPNDIMNWFEAKGTYHELIWVEWKKVCNFIYFY